MLLRNLSTTVAAQFIGVAIGMITSVIVNRALLPQGKGLLATYLVTVDLILAFATFGLPKATVYEVGQKDGHKDVIANAMALGLANGVLVGLLTLALGLLPAGGVLNQLPTNAFLIAALTGFVVTVMEYDEAILRGLNEIWLCNRGALLRRLAYLALVAGLAAWGQLTLELTLLAFWISSAITAAYYHHFARRRAATLRLDSSTVQAFTRYGLKYQGYALVSLLHNRIDVLIMSALLTTTAIGYYSTAVNLAQLLWNLPTAISYALFAHIVNQRRVDQSAVQTTLVTRISTLILLASGGLIALLAPWIIVVLYGPEYRPSVEPLRVLLPGIVAFGVVRIMGGHLMGNNRLAALTLSSAGILAMNVALNLILMPVFGPTGASLASSLTYTANAIVIAWLVSQEGYVSMRDILLPRRSDFVLLWSLTLRALRSARSSVVLMR